MFFRKYKQQLYFHLLLNFIVAICITLSSYYHTPLVGIKEYSVYFIHLLLLQFSFFGILYFLSINKYIFYIIFPLLFIPLTLLGFYKYSLDINISKHLIEAIFEVSLLVSVDLISLRVFLLFLLLLLLLLLIFHFYNKISVNQIKSPLILFATLGIFTYFIVENYKPSTFKRRLPYVAFNSLKDYLSSNDITLKKIPNSIHSEMDSVNFIFVLGESVRADHLQLNGYHRETNPKLIKRKNLISFKKLYTNNTYTVASLKQILSDKSINDDDDFTDLYSLYSVLNAIDYTTFWIANGDIVKGYEPIIKSNQELVLVDKFKTVMSFNKSLDKEMFSSFDTIYKNSQKQFISMHMIGSHWWYENRYSNEFKKYKPVIKSKYIPSLKKEEIINSYDNTLVYLDSFLDELINKIENNKGSSIIMYLSDHGESLGENGKWLHAQVEKACMNPAMIVWYSDDFKNKYPSYVKALESNSKKDITTDFFYHSVLDFYKIKNFNYDKNLSVFRQ